MNTELIIKEIAAVDTWQLRHSVMWPNKPMDYIKLKEDNSGFHFGCYVNNELVSIVSLFIKNNQAQFRKLATIHTAQGKGYATLLLKHVFKFAEHKNVASIWCNARANKINFYKKFGMLKTTKTYNKGGIDFVVMKKMYD